MRIHCPQCHAAYEIGPLFKNAVFVCHRCQTEFAIDGADSPAGNPDRLPADNSLPLFIQAASDDTPRHSRTVHATPEERRSIADIPETHAQRETSPETPTATNALIPPTSLRRKKSRIWPWMVMILLLLGGSGFYFKQDAWLNHPWVRSLLLNARIALPPRNEDWRIVSESVHGEWITRQDGSRILLIEGKVENRLYYSMNPPAILVRFFAPGANEPVAEQTLPITEPPVLKQIQRAPYISPGKDSVPIESRGGRTFMLVIEGSPEGANHFELSPVAVAR